MQKVKKLIEVAMPIKEISAESVRDKSIRHGHISTLHLWWARRPLPVCRAVVFASLVPDPLDELCPLAFREAVQELLGTDSRYKPYDDIPYTAIADEMPDNLRNRLMMFIGKFSETYSRNTKNGKITPAKDQIDDACLIKWDNKNNKEILNKARKLIWVAYNAGKQPEKDFTTLSREFDEAFRAIEQAEEELYVLVDRHIENEEVVRKEEVVKRAIADFQSRMPSVFDPFAGGGAIPLEAARLGCRSYGNDINPVAHIIEKGSLEFPQKYGKPIRYTLDEFQKIYGEEGVKMLNERGIPVMNGVIHIPNRLSFDVEYYAKKILRNAEKEVGYLYPADEEGNKPIAYYWARTATCSNPSCRAEVPLLKQFYLANTKTKKVYLNPVIVGNHINFELSEGKCDLKGWLNSNLVCPCCGATISVKELKQQASDGNIRYKLLAGIYESYNGKVYRSCQDLHLPHIIDEELDSDLIPSEDMQKIPDLISGRGWGIDKWYQMFSKRQLTVIQCLIKEFKKIKSNWGVNNDRYNVLLTLIAIWLDRICIINTSLGRWHVTGEKIEHPFSKQAIPMMFDYPESNPFCASSGSALNQLGWIIRYIESECTSPFSSIVNNASSGEKGQFDANQMTAVITDPPYYDAISYADLSDFFYVWLKRTVGDIYPLNFATPQTPKFDECTAMKHRHEGDVHKANSHFESKLTQIFDAIEYQTSDIVSIMFAHQSTQAWTTLCNSILSARMNITGSWPIDTELANRSLALAGAALESSVTVSCRPSQREGYGSFRKVKEAIEKRVVQEVEELYALGFRGADLITACFGQAVSEFGKYQVVEKADGTQVTVPDLLEMAKITAFNALLKGFQSDEYTKFYIGWLQLNGLAETDFDDAAKFTRIGLSVDVGELFQHHLLIKNGNKQSLATYAQRVKKHKWVGTQPGDSLIDQVHQAMSLYAATFRKDLLVHIAKVAASPDSTFWRVLVSLKELLPKGDDLEQVEGLLMNKDNLIQDCLKAYEPEVMQQKIEFDFE